MKRAVYIFLFFAFLAETTWAQDLSSLLFRSSNVDMVEDAVRGGLFIVSQEYQLKDSARNEYFGRNGRSEFGKGIALAVKVGKDFCVAGRAVKPWNYDSNFERYRNTHLPVYYKTRYRELTDSIMKEAPAAYNAADTTALVPGSLYRIKNTGLYEGEGFEVDATPGQKKGWLIWISANRKLEQADSLAATSYVIYRHEVELKQGVTAYETDASSIAQEVWGGIYVVPQQDGIGRLTFRLAGIMVEKAGKWYLQACFAGQGSDAPDTENLEGENKEDTVLTPVTPAPEDKGGKNPDDGNEDQRKDKKKRRK